MVCNFEDIAISAMPGFFYGTQCSKVILTIHFNWRHTMYFDQC